jgi:hypothetical protein
MSWFVQNALIYRIFGSWFQREIIMVFNATFNNISAISWRSVLLVEETAVPRENHWPVASLYNIFLIQVDISYKLNKKQIW